MKKFRLLSGLVMALIVMQSIVMADECTKSPVYDNSCPADSTFYGKLRHGQQYFLNDDWYARGGTNELRGFDASINEQCDYNNSDIEQIDGFFDYSPEIIRRNYLMPARTDPYWIITSNLYQVYKKPPQRNDHNMLVKYKVYYTVNGGSEKTHTECKYYAITRCGDGILDTEVGSGETREPEQCDHGANNGKDGKCTIDCKKVEVKDPKCSSEYNAQTKYTETSADWLKSTDKLCEEGEVDQFRSTWNEGQPRDFTWFCKNSENKSTPYACNAKQQWCGDGAINGPAGKEDCDDGDKNGTEASKCSAECKYKVPACSSEYNGKNIYTSSSSASQSVVSQYVNMNNLCGIGTLTPNTFLRETKTGIPRITYYWGCTNGTKTIDSKACHLNQYRCGDGHTNKGDDQVRFIDGKIHFENCDPNDPNIDGECNNDCTYAMAGCGPKAGTGEYNSGYSNPRITDDTPGLCGTGRLLGHVSYDKDTGNYTWECINGNGTKEISCNARDLRCGDGKIQTGYEACDPNHPDWKNGKGLQRCNNKCEIYYVQGPECNSIYNNQTEYTTTSTPWLTASKQPSLCANGTVKSFNQDDSKQPRAFTWACETAGVTTGCIAYQEWCGDGVLQEDKGEKCDYAAKTGNRIGRGDGCSQSCQPTYRQAECGSEFNDINNMKKEYLDINLSWLYENTPGLCDAGTVTGFRKHIDSPIYTWQCENHGKFSNECVADQERCGDGVLQKTEGEECDDGPNNGTKNSSCSKQCKTISELNCGSKGGSTTYFSTMQTQPWLGNANNEMCATGLNTGQPSIVGSDHHMEWKCSNQNGSGKICKAYQEYCGDGKVQTGYGEQCEGGNNCNEFCEFDTRPDPTCTQTFEGVLRCGSGYRLEDIYHNNGTIDIWLYDFDVKFQPGYNIGGKPNFVRTNVLTENNMKVKAGQSMEIIEANPMYVIKNCPEKRSKNNLYMEYTTRTTIKDYNGQTVPNGQLIAHKECGNYIITRCGDGELDEEYGEECDPGSAGTTILSDGRICNADCKAITVPAPVCNSKYNGQPVDNLTEGPHLCSEGNYTTGSFNFNPQTNTWTWKCDNVAGIGKECSATKKVTPKGTPDIKKTLQNKVEVKEVGQKLDWEVKVTAKGGDITDFEIWDVMPNELKYLGWEYKNGKPDGLTVTKLDKVGTSGDNKVYYWNVTGTLQEGNSLTIVVKSEVKEMPASGANILNIACVNDDGKVICDPEPVPAVCNSVYSGQTVNNLKETDDLCIIGKVTGFKFDETTNKWTWGCNNEESTVSCWAQKPSSPKGEPKIEKTLKNKVIVNAVNQKLTWTVKVTAKGGDIKDFKVRDKLPNVLKYDTFRVVKNQDNLKVSSKPSGPVESGSYNIYTWDVTGTLQEGHELIIEIDSIVVKMPTKKDDYRNIACVEDDNKIDCDDAKPGTAEILKELQKKREVTETGQELDWKVTVIASGGDIENFEIWDKLPVELDYAGWELDKANTQDKVTVTHDDKRSPKLSGDVNIHYWNVDGVLYSGNKITMIVKSTVKRMPKSGEDILNVACVVQSGNEIDCAEDNPPSSKGEPEIEKTLKNKVIVNAVNQKLTWTVKVTAKGGDIKDFKVRDKLPKVLKYQTYRVVKNEDKLKLPNQPSGPVESGSNNIYTWNVTGTLHEGHELILEIDSIVVKMPTKKDDYLNVACVEDDNKIDCDDAKPGTAEILKELQKKREVTETGQELDWKVTVIASGGDIENFEIWDKLPIELDYAGWELDKANTQDKVTVTHDDKRSPKLSGDVNIHYWNVDGVLYSGNKITMIVKSTVKRMPKSGEDILNVACVVQSGNEIDCAEDNPPKPGGKLVIQKTLNPKKLVTETGEILTWDIKVTASGGAVTGGFKISDIVPYALEFTGVYNKESNEAGLKMGKRYTGSISDLKTREGGELIGEVWTLDVSGDLKQNQSLVLRVTTRVVKMPKTEDDYRNVACVIKDDTQECDDDKPKQKPDLRIKKHFTDGTKSGKNVKIGDEIAYRIDFGNSGNTVASITSIKDFLPKNVKYKSSEIFVNGKKIHTESTQSGDEKIFKGFKAVDGIHIDIYGGIDLNPGYTGYIILTGEVLRDFTGYTTNFACIYLNDEVIDCDDATHKVEPNEVMCKSDIKGGSQNCSGDSMSVNVTCESDGGNADTIKLFCDDEKTPVESIKNATILTGTCNFKGYDSHKARCEVNGSKKAITGSSCEGTYNITNNCGGPSCFIAGTKVTMADGSQKNIEDVKIGEKVLGSNGTVNTVLGFHRPLLGEKELWSINGGKYFVTAEHPFMTTEGWKSLNPELTKIGMENLPVGLLEVGDTLITENGNIEIYSLDAKKSSEDTQLYNFKLDGDHTYYADSYLVHNKGGHGTPTCSSVRRNGTNVTCTANGKAYFKLQCGNKTYYSYEGRSDDDKAWRNENPQEYRIDSYTFRGVSCNSQSVKCSISQYDHESGPWTSNSSCIESTTERPEEFEQCFNVNAGNFSIEEGEIFPFFWNMHNLEVWIDQLSGDDRYMEIDGDYKNAQDKLNNPSNLPGCDDTDDDLKVAKDSMVCTFKIYGGGQGNASTKTPLYTIEGPCLSAANPLKESGLIKAWYNAMTGTYCGGSNKCYFSFDPNRDDDRGLLPSAVYYIQKFGSGATLSLNVDSWGGDWELGGNQDKEKNKPFGEYKIVLENVEYLQCMGDGENYAWEKVSPDDYFTPCQNNFVLTDPYTVQKTPSGNLTASTKKLSNYKYLSGTSVFSALLGAISASEYTPNSKVNDAMDAFIKKYEKLAVKVETNKFGENGVTVMKVPGKDIYFLSGEATFKQSSSTINKPFTIVQTHGSTTIDGNLQHNMMLLTKGNITFKGNCTSDQKVKGIFYAGGNLNRHKKYRNNSSNTTTWCTNGGLHVQGVLIGNNFNNLMENSRSHLNDWFNKEDKKKSVMDGASVLIEYSPSIFTKGTMPPGAEDFTTALSIYKN